MCDKELLVGYLYDEVDPAERRMFESHLLTCAECRGELRGLRTARQDLSTWAPPEPALEFHIVRGPAAAPAVTRRWLRSPAWGLAAAAVLVMAVASAVANVEVKYGGDGLTIRTGWARSTEAPVGTSAATGIVTASAPNEALRTELQRINSRLRELESTASARPTMTAMHTSSQSGQVQPSDLLRQVRQLLSESESRQERELALRISQVLRDVDGARRVDLDRMQRGLAEVQGVADTTIIRQRAMEDHFLRVVQQKN